MSRPLSMSQRPLTLTEELEKLEQSITLTLQEIDHNFSQAHRIVTTSILPVVEQYAESSRDVWEGAKFWKQFFEASANVSLSGYEERPNEDDSMRDQTVTEDDESANVTQTTEHTSYEGPSSAQLDAHHRGEDDLELTALSLSSHSTPRHPQQQERVSRDNDTTVTSSIARPSPYETLKHEVVDFDSPLPPPRQYEEDDLDLDHDLPSTPGRGQPRYGPTGTPTMSSSPFVPPVSHDAHKSSDPVMHRLQDKTYRVQATPIGKSYGNRPKFTITPKQTTSSSRFNFDSPLSSPELEAPQLNSEIFSPVKDDPETPNISRKRRPSGPRSRTTPKPGISVLTPAKGKNKKPIWDSDDDFDDDDMDFVGGPSPPKTMQFHIPQSRLMKTPAKEASKRIVEDLLFTAGANDTTDDLPEEYSPSVIRRAERLEDETF